MHIVIAYIASRVKQHAHLIFVLKVRLLKCVTLIRSQFYQIEKKYINISF